MPKLLQINVVSNSLSTGKIAEGISNVVLSHGWESYIAYGRWAVPGNSKLLKIGPAINTYLHFIEQKIFDNEGLSSRIVTKRFIECLKQIKPDVIHLHIIHDHYINYKLLFEYFRTINVPVVWTFHDCWAITGHCMHFSTAKCERWTTLCHDCPIKNEYPKTLLDRSSSNYLLKKELFGSYPRLYVVPVSQWLGDLVKRSFLHNKLVSTIHNGIDLSIFNFAPKESHRKFRIIAVSNGWVPFKGTDDIFKLRQKLPVSEYEIMMIGLNQSQLRTLPNGIVGLSRTHNVSELVRYYQEADVLINPTYADTFPTVNLEALACGTPVITYRTGGSPEAIDAKTGVVVEQGDIEGMASAIVKLKNHPLSSMDCRRRVESLFDKNYCFEKYYDLYTSILSEK